MLLLPSVGESKMTKITVTTLFLAKLGELFLVGTCINPDFSKTTVKAYIKMSPCERINFFISFETNLNQIGAL